MKKRISLVLTCLLLILSLCSCWSRRELNTLAIVLGTAFDVGDQPDTLTLTAQVVKAGEIKSGSSSSQGGTASGKAYANLSYTDKSVLSLVRGITHFNNRRLYFPHNQILIFSSDLAKKDVAEGLDSFMRDYEGRMNVYIMVSEGKASDILNEELELEKIPAIHISELMENQKANSETAVVTLRDFSIATLSGSRAPVAPIIRFYESEGKKKATLEGTAVFKKGKMIGELDKSQTRGLLWLTGEARSGVTTVDTKWGDVILEIVHSSSSLKPVKTKDGKIRMNLRISADGFIESNETTVNMSSPENINMLKELESKTILSDVGSVHKLACELSADMFGFGEAILREYPKDWGKMKNDWDNLFSKIDVDIQIEVLLRSTGGLTKPVVPGGAA